VAQFPTEAEFLAEVLQRCEEKVTLEHKREYLKKFALYITANDSKEFSLIHAQELQDMFDLRVDLNNHSEATRKAFERIDMEIKELDKQPELQAIHRKDITSTSSSSSTIKTSRILIAASVTAVVIIGYFLWRRKSK